MYPRVMIDQEKLKHNTVTLTKMLSEKGIIPYFVTKAVCADLAVVKVLIDAGVKTIADSRLANLTSINIPNINKVLLRIPMLSEISDVVTNTDISLNSELDIIKQIDQEAQRQNKIHKIILMFDLGDLREGILYTANYLDIVAEILLLKHVKLLGIGTNLTCYGGVLPTKEKMDSLIAIKNNIETALHVKLEVISGGNSSSLSLLYTNDLTGINNLRIGEALFLGNETAYQTPIANMHDDVFILEAEIVEIKEKPSLPIGAIGLDAFGNKPDIQDLGIRRRAILAIGKQDTVFNNLIPLCRDITIVGGSSDHLIVDIASSTYALGDIIRFKLQYGALLQAFTSKYVRKVLC